MLHHYDGNVTRAQLLATYGAVAGLGEGPTIECDNALALWFARALCELQNASSTGSCNDPLARTLTPHGKDPCPCRKLATGSGVRRNQLAAAVSTPRTIASPAHASGGDTGTRKASAAGGIPAERENTRMPLHARPANGRAQLGPAGNAHSPTIAPFSAEHVCPG